MNSASGRYFILVRNDQFKSIISMSKPGQKPLQKAVPIPVPKAAKKQIQKPGKAKKANLFTKVA